MNRILLIEDDEAIRDIIKEALSAYTVIAIEQTNDIFNSIDEYKPELVLMDYILPNINGGELCHQIKANPSTCHIPVVIISGFPKVLYSLGTYGCDAVLEKPFDLSKLLDTVARFDKVKPNKAG